MPARSCTSLIEQGLLALQGPSNPLGASTRKLLSTDFGSQEPPSLAHAASNNSSSSTSFASSSSSSSSSSPPSSTFTSFTSSPSTSTSTSTSASTATATPAASITPSVSSSSSSSSPPSKLIFEDVDGVLNHSRSGDGTLDPDLLKNLGNLVRSTDASVVISSAWRKHEEGLRWLIQKGLVEGAGIPKERIIGQTPSLCWGVDCRASEIRAWLDAHPDLAARAKWVAIDDQDVGAQDPEYMAGHFVQTEASKGLTKVDAQRAHLLLVPEETPESIRAAWSDTMKSFL